ncbi:MAG: chorismate mutase [Candidatus Korobacteraceae bacterium]
MSLGERVMDIADWRKKIDEIDRKLVELINERAQAARAIGAIKRERSLPIYEPEREREIYERINQLNQGPLREGDLIHIYERLIDVMRALQQEDGPATRPAAASAPGSRDSKGPS